MNHALSASTTVVLVLLAALATASRPAMADTATECRQEAELYGVPPEQFDDYVDGCVLSRGGYTAVEQETDSALPEAAVMPDEDAGLAGDTPYEAVPPLYESGQEAGDGAQ